MEVVVLPMVAVVVSRVLLPGASVVVVLVTAVVGVLVVMSVVVRMTEVAVVVVGILGGVLTL